MTERSLLSDAGLPRLPVESRWTTSPERRVKRWEREQLVDAVRKQIEAGPQAMRVRREAVAHPSGLP